MNKKGVSRFSVGIFLSQIAKKTSWANPSVFQKRSGIKNFLDNSGITILLIFFVSQYRNIS